MQRQGVLWACAKPGSYECTQVCIFVPMYTYIMHVVPRYQPQRDADHAPYPSPPGRTCLCERSRPLVKICTRGVRVVKTC